MTFLDNEDKVENGHLQEPEHVLPIAAIAAENILEELISNCRYIKGKCDNKFQNSKPKLYFIDRESFARDHQISSIKLVLEQCLKRGKQDVVIFCNTPDEVELVELALATSDGNEAVKYIPYLECIIRGDYPTSQDKQCVLDKIKKGCILIGDYRSYKGCEASHSITILDLNKPVGANIMVEMMTRTMAYLDIIVLPKIVDFSYTNPVASALTKWEKRGWIEHITVEIDKETDKEDEDEDKIFFNLNCSTYSKESIVKSDKCPRSRDDFNGKNAVDTHR